MASELEDLREAFHKLANRDFTDLVVSERAKGAADMRERAAKLITGHATAAHLTGLSGLGCKLSDLVLEVGALPLDGGDGE